MFLTVSGMSSVILHTISSITSISTIQPISMLPESTLRKRRLEIGISHYQERQIFMISSFESLKKVKR